MPCAPFSPIRPGKLLFFSPESRSFCLPGSIVCPRCRSLFVNRSSYGPTPSHSSFLPVASVVHVGVSAAGKFQQESLPKFVFRVLISNGLNSDRCTCFTGRLSTGNADPCCGTGASGLCAGTTKGALDVGCPWPESSAGQESSVTRSASKPLDGGKPGALGDRLVGRFTTLLPAFTLTSCRPRTEAQDLVQKKV